MGTTKEAQVDSDDATIRFSEQHLWVRAGSVHAQVGISDPGQQEAGEIIALELPEIGDRIERGEPFGQIESVRTVLELTAPVSGTVTAINGELEESPSLANEDPYHEGWLIEVDLDDESELGGLMEPERYEDLTADSESES